MRTLSAAALAGGVALVAISVAPRVAAASPCDAVDRLLDAGHVLQAEESYRDLVKASKGAAPDCAGQGLLRAASARCEAAVRLLRSDRPDEARKAYEAVLAAFPTSDCALAGLEALADLARRSERSCETADALASRSLGAEAREAYQAVLKTAPGARCAVDGLDALAGPLLLRRARQAVEETGGSLLVLLGAVGGPLLVLILFVRWLLLSRPLQLKLELDEVAAGGSGLSDGPCRQVLSLIEHELRELTREPRFGAATVIDGPVAPPALPELSGLSKGTNALWNALLALLPTRTVSLSAVLLDSSGGGGILLRLVHQPTKELWGTLVISDGRPPGRPPTASKATDTGIAKGDGKGDAAGQNGATAGYARLTHAAAAWACWTIHERIGHPRRFRGKSCDEAGCTELRRAFGTAKWRSYWKAAQGAAERRRDPLRAKRALRESLLRDPANRLAAYNLAVLELSDRADELERDGDLYERLVRSFESACLCTPDGARSPDGTTAFDPIRMFSTFHLGEMAFYRHFAFEASGPHARKHLERAEALFREAQEQAEKSPEQAREVALHARIARATCARVIAGEQRARELLGSCERDVLSELSLINLACFYSNPGSGAGSDADMAKANDYLAQALELAPSLEALVRKDPALRRLWRHRELLQERHEPSERAFGD